MGGKGEVLLVDGTPIQTIIDRINGCKTVAKQFPGIQIVGQQASKNDRASGLAVTTDMLTANPDVQGIFGMNDPSALGAVLAVEQAGKADQIIVTGVDGSPEGVSELEAPGIAVRRNLHPEPRRDGPPGGRGRSGHGRRQPARRDHDLDPQRAGHPRHRRTSTPAGDSLPPPAAGSPSPDPAGRPSKGEAMTNASTPPLLQLEDVSKRFGATVALNRVHFDLRAGEVHALMGENGAGKSTLMKILAGNEQRDSGRILVDGNDIEIRGPNDATANGIAIIHQELNTVPSMTVAENLALGREPRTRYGALDRRAIIAARGKARPHRRRHRPPTGARRAKRRDATDGRDRPRGQRELPHPGA